MKRLLLISALALTISAHAADDTPRVSAASSSASAPAGTTQQHRLPNYPAQVEIKSLTRNWRHFRLSTQGSAYDMYAGRMGPFYEVVLQEMGIGVYFTKGDSVTIGKENYLVAYQIDPGMEQRELQREIQQRIQQYWGHGEQAKPRPVGKFSPRATLKLSLLNTRHLGDLQDLREFNPKRDLYSPADIRGLSDQKLQRIGQWLHQYQRYQGANRGLPLRDVATLRDMLEDHFHADPGLLRNPATEDTYRVNTALAGKKPKMISNKKVLPAVYEATPSSDGTRGVVFADGHVERVPEWRWKTIYSTKIAGPTARDWRVLSHENLRRVGQAFFEYSYEYDDDSRLPAFYSHDGAVTILREYIEVGEDVLREPKSNRFYRYNLALSRLKLSEVTNRKNIVVAYEPQAGSDGKIGAVFLDGKVRRVAPAQWKAVLAAKPILKATKKTT